MSHPKISEYDFIKYLESMDDDFDNWNTTSLSGTIPLALGVNGPKIRRISIDLFKRLIEWRKTKPTYYMPSMGVEKMPSVVELEQDLFYIITSTPDYSNPQSILENYYKYKESHKITEYNPITDMCSIQ